MARAEAPRSLLAFTQRTFPGYRPSRVHAFIAGRLDGFLLACEAGKSPRLLITCPPRTGKSELASIRLPALALGRNPDWQIIHASYTAELSHDFSRQVRNLLREPEYQGMFPGVLPALDSAAVHRWGVAGRRGVFVSSGVGGPLTGRGADVLIIDDPLKGDQDADSELFRRRQRDWYAAVARSRLQKGAGILLMMTRWNVEDLGGYVASGAGTDEPPGEAWEVVNLPAVAEPGDALGRAEGEALWPEEFDLGALAAVRRQLPPRWWAALYQGNPVAAFGNLLPVARVVHDALPPAGLKVVQAWDLAISERQTADYTAVATLGMDGDRNVYLLDIDRGRWSFNETIMRMGEAARVWNPVQIAIETAGYQAAAFQEASRRHLLPFKEVKPDRDKATRAQLLADRMEMGKVYANRAAPWWRIFEAEALAFPAGAHDDQVDAAVYALGLLASPPVEGDFVF